MKKEILLTALLLTGCASKPEPKPITFDGTGFNMTRQEMVDAFLYYLPKTGVEVIEVDPKSTGIKYNGDAIQISDFDSGKVQSLFITDANLEDDTLENAAFKALDNMERPTKETDHVNGAFVNVIYGDDYQMIIIQP